MDIIETRNAARCGDFQLRLSRKLTSLLYVRAAKHSVPGNVSVNNALHAEILHCTCKLNCRDFRRVLPTPGFYLTVQSVDANANTSTKLSYQRLELFRRFVRQRSKHNPLNARINNRLYIQFASYSSSELNRNIHVADNTFQNRAIRRSNTRECAIKIDHVNHFGACSRERTGHGNGIVVIDLRLVHLALDKSYASSVFQINRR